MKIALLKKLHLFHLLVAFLVTQHVSTEMNRELAESTRR